MSDYMQFESECLTVIAMFKNGLIPSKLQTRYPGDNILIDTIITDKFILSISNIHEDAEKGLNTYLRSLFVIKPLRNKGVGTKLLNDLINTCKGKGINGIETEPLNNRSRKFFAKHGFKKIIGTTCNRHILYLNQ